MGFKNNNIPWNKGLTKETDERVRINSENVSKAKKGMKGNFSGKTHKIESRNKISKSRKGKYAGKKHPNWNGGSFIYWHKQAKIILEKTLNIKFGNMKDKKILIHHIDKNYKNNNINNLKIMSVGEHSKLHNTKNKEMINYC